MRKIVLSLIGLLLLLVALVWFESPKLSKQAEAYVPPRQSLVEQNFDPISIIPEDSSFISYTVFRQTIATAQATPQTILSGISGKTIRIDTAEELYWFSIDVSYNPDQFYVTSDPSQNVKLSYEVIEVLLSLDYVLGNDIDYSIMKSKQFIPIGYSFFSVDETLKHNVFTGTFDGRGFEISNLYFAGYDFVTTEEEVQGVTIDIALSPYYAMFTQNDGIIKNLGLINPTLELLIDHEDITKTANLVGKNTGTVEFVYVRDTRTSAFDAGIRMRVPSGTTANFYTAGGIVHDNEGTFIDSYYTSRVTVNASYINNFIVQPVLYQNSGTINNLVYDVTIYLTQLTIGSETVIITPANTLATGETTTNLRSGNSLLAGSLWQFYAQDTYPNLLGLNFNGQSYEISNALELFAFSKIIHYNTIKNGVLFRNANYILVNDIDMSHLARGAYVTPNVEFTGTLSGEKAGGGNYYIHHLHIINGRVISGAYFSGLFSVLSGTVQNITIASGSITLNNTASFPSAIFRIGMIAGRLNNGTINQISVSANISLGTRTIGRIYAGGIVGQASGNITNVYNEGNINGGTRTYNPDLQVIPTYYLGGIVGAADGSKLTIYNVLNKSDITGLSNTGAITTQGTTVSIVMGGVIGFISNTSSVKHSIGVVSNEGTLTINNFVATIPIRQYVGGIFGLSQGPKYTLSNEFGQWENRGNIAANQTNASTIVRSAGIGVSNHSEQVEFVLLTNKGNFTTATYTNFNYTSLIYDMSATSGVIISQSSNESNYTFTSQPANFSPVYFSENNAPSILRFVENKGDLTFSNFTTIAELRVAGLTLSSNIDFLNVYYSGKILVHTIVSAHPIYVAGITHTLSTNRYIKNSLNDGEMVVGGINAGYNVYVGGLVNLNNAGNLHTQDTSTVPIASSGIINSINYATITSTHTESIYGINGNGALYGNLFASGIATLNKGSIQDSANLGDISFVNLATILHTNTTYYTIRTEDTLAGLFTKYSAGVAVGGITAAVTHGESRIYDSVNNGDIIGIARNYVRSGGILAVVLYAEVNGGGITVNEEDATQNSILSNCVNYGNIVALSQMRAEYITTGQVSTSFSLFFENNTTADGPNITVTTRASTEQRPAVYSSAGGIIGYGLSTMRRMINHGSAAASDVAGGIVGATYVIGGTDSPTTTVKIDTAINYGSVRAINNANYASVNKTNMSYNDISSYFYATNDTFIFPNTISDIRRYPESKRGIGGIFGRLQRGWSGVMTAEGGIFNFIVNTDPNVDLIGRLDQVYNFSSSSRFFRFNDCIYYSAKENDTTQVVFSGFSYRTGLSIVQDFDIIVSHKRTTITRISGRGGNTRWEEKVEYYVDSGTITSTTDEIIYEKVGLISTLKGDGTSVSVDSISNQYILDSVTTFTRNPNQVTPGSTYVYYDPPLQMTYTTTSTSTSKTYHENVKIAEISEDPMGSYGEFMYDETFVMRDDNTLLPNGEAITSYIFYVENGLLADRFQTTRPYGMYVLSTTAGSAFGSVLPSNLDLTKVYRLADILPFDANYEQIDMSYKQEMSEVEGVKPSYLEMIQTLYNDKSHLIEEDQTFYLEEESGGSETLLLNPTIDYANKAITFEISLEAFDTQQMYAYYRIAAAQLPNNALIAASIEDYDGGSYVGDLDGFRHLLYLEKFANISTNLAPTLAINLSDYIGITSDTMPIKLGEFISYSEAAINNTIFMNVSYFTKYEVFLILKPRLGDVPGGISVTNVIVDGVSRNPNAYYNTPVVQTITFEFLDTSGLLINGTDIKNFIKLFYNGEQVASQYYTLTTQPVSSGSFSFTLTLTQHLRSGEYTIYYRYFFVGTEYSAPFVKAGSNNKTITDLSHYSSDTFVPFTGNSFTTYINFGAALDFNNISWQAEENLSLPSYLSRTTYIVSFLTSITLSPFASINAINYIGYTYDQGYRVHEVRYTIGAENTTTEIYIHYIRERTIDIVEVFKDNNSVSIDNIFATREAHSTIFALDFKIDSLYATDIYNTIDTNPNAYFAISVMGETFDGVAFAPESIMGITYSADVLLYITMDYQTLPGFYYFSITYNREGQIITIETEIMITKNRGVNAYLSDIRFSESATETAYPSIAISNNVGTIIPNTGYTLRVYFAGIDYDESDEAGFVNFRIDGQVANTPLDMYVPYFLNYLPYGATIARKAYDKDLEEWYWTDEVDINSPDEIKALLATDFTIFPDTGLEGSEGNDVIITYRVTSEDGESEVFYHITVVDIVYNVSLLFTIYYVENDVAVLARDSILIGKPIIINVKNFNTEVEPTTSVAGTVASFPSFTTITGYNNNTTQFNVPHSALYRYGFGRNISGFYAFRIQLERDLNGNQLYEYYITFNGDPLNAVSNYVEGVEGEYYYIETGTRNRTRRFNVYISLIENVEENQLWGLTDYYYSWDN